LSAANAEGTMRFVTCISTIARRSLRRLARNSQILSGPRSSNVISAHLTAIAGIYFNLQALLLLAMIRAMDSEQGGWLSSNIFKTLSSYKPTIIPGIQQRSSTKQALPLDSLNSIRSNFQVLFFLAAQSLCSYYVTAARYRTLVRQSYNYVFVISLLGGRC
jgi:hypothetical protein